MIDVYFSRQTLGVVNWYKIFLSHFLWKIHPYRLTFEMRASLLCPSLPVRIGSNFRVCDDEVVQFLFRCCLLYYTRYKWNK